MRIPFSQLRYPERRPEEQTWGLQIWRQGKPAQRAVACGPGWAPDESGWSGAVRSTCRDWRHPQGPRSRRSHAVRVGAEHPRARQCRRIRSTIRHAMDGRVGGDAMLRVTSNLTLNATINPDFGQVEVDPQVVNLSQYETFLQEKRPFFVEGAGYFGLGGLNCYFCSNVSESQHAQHAPHRPGPAGLAVALGRHAAGRVRGPTAHVRHSRRRKADRPDSVGIGRWEYSKR